MIFSDVTFHEQNGYSEENSPVTYHLKTNFLLSNIFPVNLQNYIKFCPICMNVATDINGMVAYKFIAFFLPYIRMSHR